MDVVASVRRDRGRAGVTTRRAEPLILLYNSFWGHLPDLAALRARSGCRLATDRSLLRRADAVWFHLPQLDPGEVPAKTVRPGLGRALAGERGGDTALPRHGLHARGRCHDQPPPRCHRLGALLRSHHPREADAPVRRQDRIGAGGLFPVEPLQLEPADRVPDRPDGPPAGGQLWARLPQPPAHAAGPRIGDQARDHCPLQVHPRLRERPRARLRHREAVRAPDRGLRTHLSRRAQRGRVLARHHPPASSTRPTSQGPRRSLVTWKTSTRKRPPMRDCSPGSTRGCVPTSSTWPSGRAAGTSSPSRSWHACWREQHGLDLSGYSPIC
jgi:hypothetical protein